MIREYGKPFKLTTGACNYYIKNVKNNSNDSYDLAARKLTRNFECGKPAPNDLVKEGELRYYENMAILVKHGTIVWVMNYRDKKASLEIDIEKKLELEKELGLHKEVIEVVKQQPQPKQAHWYEILKSGYLKLCSIIN